MPRAKKEIRPQVVTPEMQPAETVALDALLRGLKHDPREIIRPLEDPDKVAEEAEELGKDFRKYLSAAWPYAEPATFIPNWHIDAMCEHLIAVTEGDILDLLITMPPRHSKSLVLVVMWPTWEWIEMPSYRWLFNSYSFNLSVRDSIKRRKVIKSQWYQERWADRFAMLPEQDTKARYENDKGGFQLASSVSGSNTGEGGERIIADDPHNIKEAESETIRKTTVDWWNIVMSTRRNDLKKSARVVVQQRTHEADVAGDIIERGGYVHLNLPTEFGFGGGQRCRTGWTHRATGEYKTWEDPRTREGELLNPARFDEVENEKAKLTLGDYQYAAQHGQNPAPPTGTIIQAQWLKYYGGPTGVPIPDWTQCKHAFMPLLTLDCTFKEHKDTDYVAGLVWAMFGADIYLLPICIHEHLSFTSTIDKLAWLVGGPTLDNSTRYEGVYPFVKIKLVEDKANGSAVIDTMRHRIAGMLPFEPGSDSKEARMISASWRFKAGNVYLPHESLCTWIKEYIYEICAFPKAKRDDYADATSMAMIFIGGDQTFQGTPIMPQISSRWLVMSDTLIDEDRTESVWGQIAGGRTWR